MKTYYDIHYHIFIKDIIIRKLVNVVQLLLTVKDMLADKVSAEELRYKINRTNKTLEGSTQDFSENVYKTATKFNRKNLTTPTIFDLHMTTISNTKENSF